MKLSASLVRTYKMCRRKYELRYLEELEPVAYDKRIPDEIKSLPYNPSCNTADNNSTATA